MSRERIVKAPDTDPAVLTEGDRVLLDGAPGTVEGPGGYEPEHGWCFDIRMDSGERRWARSGSRRLERVPTHSDDDLHASLQRSAS